jgi:hypothetical protein
VFYLCESDWIQLVCCVLVSQTGFSIVLYVGESDCIHLVYLQPQINRLMPLHAVAEN